MTIHRCRLLMRETDTHDVQRFVFTRPDGFSYAPGQGVELAIDRDDWRDEWRPFTPTSLTEDAILQFIIKAYPSHDGVTTRLHDLAVGDTVLLRDVFGTIRYRGPGMFIAAGTGITPFVSIARTLADSGAMAENALLFANKTHRDVVDQNELMTLFGERCHFVLSDEDHPGYIHGTVDRELLQRHVRDIAQYFYVCGPDGFIDSVVDSLISLGVVGDKIVVEDA